MLQWSILLHAQSSPSIVSRIPATEATNPTDLRSAIPHPRSDWLHPIRAWSYADIILKASADFLGAKASLQVVEVTTRHTLGLQY